MEVFNLRANVREGFKRDLKIAAAKSNISVPSLVIEVLEKYFEENK
jgi:predicted HicB family RNase H-like nuclease